MTHKHSAVTELPAQIEKLPLAGVRICLVFELSLSHYTRILMEIEALQAAGATIQLLTSHLTPEDAPADIPQTIAPLHNDNWIPGSKIRWRPARIARRRAMDSVQRAISWAYPEAYTRLRIAALEKLARQVDLFWVIDYPSLTTVVNAAQKTNARILYETVDLVPELQYRSRRELEGERRVIGRVDGFITACDSYADYYVERYGDSVLQQRPVVRDNMPPEIATRHRPSGPPLRLVFLGSLMFDRPVSELIESVARSTKNVTLTLQGKNYLGEKPLARIAELGLQDRVKVLEPCAPEEIVQTTAEYDIGVVALRGENENERRASTSKLFTYMAAGLVILGSDLPGIARVVKRHSNGVLVGGMRPADWAMAIDKLASMPSSAIDSMKQRSLDAAQLYAWDKQRPAFLAEFLRALGRTGRETASEVAQAEFAATDSNGFQHTRTNRSDALAKDAEAR